MNLTDIKQPQTAEQFANSMQNTFGVSVDIAKLNLDKSQRLLLSVNEEIQKQRLSEDRHKLHTTKSYLAKIFIKENLEKHITELEEAAGKTKKDKKPCPEDVNEWSNPETASDADAQRIPGQGGSSMGGFGAGKEAPKATAAKKAQAERKPAVAGGRHPPGRRSAHRHPIHSRRAYRSEFRQRRAGGGGCRFRHHLSDRRSVDGRHNQSATAGVIAAGVRPRVIPVLLHVQPEWIAGDRPTVSRRRHRDGRARTGCGEARSEDAEISPNRRVGRRYQRAERQLHLRL